uniref:CRAL-TRIO domain-containing protein n=1 Tax=Macrostomum lignano TaxID=282301 RepID=A0A1I8HST0_9PLAT
MGNNSSNSVLHNIDSVVTRLAGRSASSSAESPTGPNSSDDPETVAARRLVCEVLRASVKEMLRQQLRAAAVRAPPRSDQAELLQAEAERLVAGVLEAAIDVLAEELVPDSQLSSAVEQLTRHRSEFRLPEARPKSERSTAVDLALLGPYLRCLSHAGVLSEGCGPAATLLVFDASRLPDCDSVREYDGIMLQLLTLLSHAIRQIRTPSFALVFLHSPATRGQFPKVAWMKQAAAWLETQSSLRRIYVLHSTFSLSTLSVLSRAFTSRAFRDLVTSVSSVQQLQELLPLLTTSVKQQLEAIAPGRIRRLSGSRAQRLAQQQVEWGKQQVQGGHANHCEGEAGVLH